MRDKIFCLMVSGLPINNGIREFLFKAACGMMHNRDRRLSVKSPDCEALLKTNFAFAILAGVAGTKFVANLEAEEGKTHVEFIISDNDVEQALKGVWVDGVAGQTSGRASKAAFN